MKMKLILLFLSIAFTFSSCKKDTKQTTDVPIKKTETTTVSHKGQASVKISEGEDPNVLQLAMSLPDFKTLVVAVQTASVEDALVNAGPLTVFAPVNEAFDKLPEGTVETLLKAENKDKLGFILKNHVAPANYPLKQLNKEAKKGRKLYMASGKYLEVERKGDDFYVGRTKILKSVKVSNGWVHVIGDVLVPSDN